MGWNHRVLATEYIYEDGRREIYFEIHEVYYKGEKPDGYTRNPVSVGSDSMEGIQWTLEMMMECLNKPILWSGDRFPEEYVKPKTK